jgi:ADP-heptose:LPS heptosyltransferase
MSLGAAPSADSAEPASVLVLRALGLGDALTAVPALRGLRRLFPGHLLVLATAHPVARLLHAHGLVDRVLPVRDLGDWPPGLALRRHVAVNLHGSGPQSHRLLDAGRPDSLLAFRCAPVHVDGPEWDPWEHEVARWCRLVRSAGGECDVDDLRLTPPPGLTAAPRVAVVHPGAAAGSRRWPPNRWAAVARALRAGGWDVVLTGSADERRLCARVRQSAGLPVTANLAGRLSVDELADLVAEAGLLLSGDTGVAHLATAFGTPSVVLFGPVAPALWGPAVDQDLHRALWHGPHGGDPHGDRPDPALLRISVAEVLAAVRDVVPAPSRSRTLAFAELPAG